jgi:hypothetical protein
MPEWADGGGGEVKIAEKKKLLKAFRQWFFDKDVTKADEELLILYGGKEYGWNFFVAYCAGYAAGKKEVEREKGNGKR